MNKAVVFVLLVQVGDSLFINPEKVKSIMTQDGFGHPTMTVINEDEGVSVITDWPLQKVVKALEQKKDEDK